ncbi:hypothetical protein [Agrobacterium tumefaciens]|uniref:hypothetical protein n=1 Tax=Agrobacterium tumefaciens TaxID=358 RepID=UPI00277E1994|nr:hypothetical protein [Agrobacterium tumefaciens]
MKRPGIENRARSQVEIARFSASAFRKSGPYFYNIVRRIDERRVRHGRIPKSVGAEDIDDLDLAKAELGPGAQKVYRGP